MTTKAKFDLKDIDRGWKDIVKTVKAIKGGGAYTKVGYFGARAEAERGDDGLTNVELGLVHEFGSADGHTPERSHLRFAFDKHRTEYEALAAKLLPKTITGELSLKQALDIMGLRASTDIKNEIAGGFIRQDLAPETMARKLAKGAGTNKKGEQLEGPAKSPKALIESGRLMGSISYATVLNGGG